MRWLLEELPKAVLEVHGDNAGKVTTREVVATVIVPRTEAHG